MATQAAPASGGDEAPIAARGRDGHAPNGGHRPVTWLMPGAEQRRGAELTAVIKRIADLETELAIACRAVAIIAPVNADQASPDPELPDDRGKHLHGSATGGDVSTT